MSRAVLQIRWIAVLLALALLPGRAGAQADSSMITGTVLTIADGTPLAGVLITVPSSRRMVTTDSAGAFVIAGLPAGDVAIRVVYQGQGMGPYIFSLKRGRRKRVEILLDAEPSMLPPIVVRATALQNRWGMAGFFARKKEGFGRFISRGDLARRGNPNLRVLLSSLGASYTCTGQSCGPSKIMRGVRCQMSVYVNGLPSFGEDINFIEADDIAGVEVYANDVDAPSELFTSNRLWLADRSYLGGAVLRSCGSVVVWTRDWTTDFLADW